MENDNMVSSFGVPQDVENALEIVVPIRSYNSHPLDDAGKAFLKSRGISEEISIGAGVVSGERKYSKSHDTVKNSIGFVYKHSGQDYAIKWRSIETKEFSQSGSAASLYLAHLITDKDRLIITEGEIDALSFWQAGLEAVSIPSGAIISARDESARLKWMALHDDILSGAKDIYLAVDMDGPGQSTAQELARRIGKARCWQVTFPAGCKDANDTLLRHGKEILSECIGKATRWPIEGITSANDYADKVLRLYESGLPRGLSTGWLSIDEIFTLNAGNLVIVTGVPGHGKTTFLDAMLVNAMKQHDWNVAYASFENPQEIHISKLIAQHIDKPFGLGPTARMDEDEMLRSLSWVNDHVTFLSNENSMPTVESLVERFETAVRRYGVKACVVDPFNFIKLPGRDGGFDTNAVNDMLAAFKLFAQRAEVVFFLVAHPAKPMNVGPDFIPTGYAIASSAHFYNRADFGLTIQRKDTESILHVWKARFYHQGRMGNCALQFNPATGGYSEMSSRFSWTSDTNIADDLPF